MPAHAAECPVRAGIHARWGAHGGEATRALPHPAQAHHPVLRGVGPAFGPSDVYGIRELPADATVLLDGQVVAGMSPDDPAVEGKKNNLPIPTDWNDLTKPVYKGHVIMPNPNSSGTGFLDVSSWIQLKGEDAAWKYMDALHENISRYTHSGSAPCKLAARGETAIGVSFADSQLPLSFSLYWMR